MRKLITAGLCLCLLLSGTSNAAINLSRPGQVSNYTHALLFVGYGRGNDNNAKFNLYTDAQLDKMLLSTDKFGFDEYVITPSMAFYGMRECVSESDINSLTQPGSAAYNYCGTHSADDLVAIRDQGLARWRAASPQRTLTALVSEEVELAVRIIQKSPTTKVWLSLPTIGAGELEIYTYKFNDPFCDFIDKLKTALDRIDSQYWRNNVAGIYWGTEDIVQWYTKFDTEQKTDFGNPVVNCAKHVSDYVHSQYNKPVLWIPYFRTDPDNEESLNRVAYVANTTNIFDAVDLQPNYYFGQTSAAILGQIKTCLDKNAVCDVGGKVIGRKTSATKIGVEMEIDGQYGSDSAKRARYAQYMTYFKPYRDLCPVGFYAGDDTEMFMDPTYDALNLFFAADAKKTTTVATLRTILSN